MTVSDEMLMAYADGELDPAQRAAVEAAMAADPMWMQRVARHRALREKLRAGYADTLNEAVPQRLLDTLQGARPQAKVVPLKRRWSWPEWTAMAASVLAGVLIAHFAARDSDPIFHTVDGHWVAQGELASALSSQLASNPRHDATIAIGLSFRDKTGDYCRTFRSGANRDLAGLACRADRDWRIEILTPAAAGGGGTFEPAASALPPLILRAVEDTISGSPLDASAEKAARDRQWRR